jgi:imidazoleglycerol-phosphate dehydratase
MITKERITKETEIALKLELYGQGRSKIDTGVGFFDHMLEAFAKHAFIDLEVSCKGDTHVDDHHTVEDVGIVIAEAIRDSIYPVENVERFGNASVVMDESCVSCDIDLSNRPFLLYDVPLDGKVGTFDVELAEEFFRALVFNSRLTAHIVLKRGRNRHHIIEAAFKAFAVALRRAVTANERAGIPSTKGVL